MELNIKNKKLCDYMNDEGHQKLDMIRKEYVLTGDIDTCSRKSAPIMQKFPEHAIMYGFLSSFLEICEMHNIEFDLTYDTVKNLNNGLIALYNNQKKSYEPTTNRNIIAKTLASVLSFIAINEHDYWFSITSYLKQIREGKVIDRPLWSNVFSYAVGKNKYLDLLPCCIEAVKPGLLLATGMSLNVESVVAEYKELTGIDLTGYGFEDLFIN